MWTMRVWRRSSVTQARPLLRNWKPFVRIILIIPMMRLLEKPESNSIWSLNFREKTEKKRSQLIILVKSLTSTILKLLILWPETMFIWPLIPTGRRVFTRSWNSVLLVLSSLNWHRIKALIMKQRKMQVRSPSQSMMYTMHWSQTVWSISINSVMQMLPTQKKIYTSNFSKNSNRFLIQ